MNLANGLKSSRIPVIEVAREQDTIAPHVRCVNTRRGKNGYHVTTLGGYQRGKGKGLIQMDTLAPSMLTSLYLRTSRRTGVGNFAHRVEAAACLLRQKDFGTLVSLVWEALFGAADMVLLRLELDSFRSDCLRRFALTARPVEPRDTADLFSLNGLTNRERRDAAARLFTLQAGIQTCYVVEDSSGRACFLQWLIPFSENEKLHRVYGEWYPDLQPDEAMIEHAYMLPSYRGSGLLPCAVAKVLENAREAGVRNIVTIIPTWNTNSLNSFIRLGFKPHMLRSDRKFFGIRHRQVRPYTCGAVARVAPAARLTIPAFSINCAK